MEEGWKVRVLATGSQEGGVGTFFPSHLPHSPPREVPGPWASEATSRQATGQQERSTSTGSPGYYEVILFLSILGKNSKYKIIIIKVKIHHLDFVVL